MPPPPPSSRLRLIPIVLAQGIGFACGVASVKLNSHLIPPEVLGFYGVFLTFTPIGIWVVYAGLLKFVNRHWAASGNRPALAREILSAWRRRLPWLALLGSTAAFLIVPAGPARIALTGLVLFVSTSLLALAALAQSALQADRAHWRDCAVAASGSLTRSFLPPLFYAAANGTVTALLLGFSLHTAIVALIGTWALQAAIRPGATGGIAARTLTSVYEGPLFTVLAFSSWLITGLNRWLVAWFFGPTEAGYFTLTGGAAIIVTSMLGTIIMQYLQPGLFLLGDGPPASRLTLARRTDLAAFIYAGVALVVMLGVNAVAPWLVGPLISPKYRDALGWLFPAGCFGIATMTAVFYHTMLLAGRRERACGMVDLTTAAILALGCTAAAAAGQGWLTRWLIVTPLLPWLVTRTMARHYFFRPAPDPMLAPAR